MLPSWLGRGTALARQSDVYMRQKWFGALCWASDRMHAQEVFVA
jgi:hypothetical protein